MAVPLAEARVVKRRAAVSLSLATLCMLKAWRELLNPAWDLFRSAPPPRLHYILAISITTLLAAIFLTVQYILSKWGPRSENFGRAGFLFLCFAALTVMRYSFGSLELSVDRVQQNLPFTFLASAAVIGIGLSWVFLRPLTHAAAICLLILSPLTAFVLGRAVWRMINPRHLEQPLVNRPLPEPTQPPRVVWIIFDEMDQHVAFADRPPGLRLPELDAVRSTALYATMATAPGTQTHYSMPALITGHAIRNVTIRDGNDLMITFANQDAATRFSESDNVFREAHRQGFRTGIAGNYLPYCRILRSDLDFCSAQLLGAEAGSSLRLGDAFAEQMQSLSSSLPFHDAFPPLSIVKEKHAANYRGVLTDAKKAAADPRLNVLLIHFPIPHLPGVLADGYVSNMTLVDDSLKQLRETMDRAGLWQTSNILISADHGFRERPGFDNRVPFLLKLAGQTRGLEYTRPFNTILTHDLILFLLSKSEPAPQMVSDWISIH